MEMTTFSMDVSELAARLTCQVHGTLDYLYNDGYLTAEQHDDLSARLIVCPVRNKPKWFGERLLNRFWGKQEDNEHLYIFPITTMQKPYRPDEIIEEGTSNESD
jgi:hypothetical protein